MKQIWKIRLKPDGTWENVYRDEFYELDGKSLVDWNNSKFVDPSGSARFARVERDNIETLAADLREMALGLSDLREAREVIAWVMKK